jgi:glycosyltransferase involved in cell wall biosynthesis
MTSHKRLLLISSNSSARGGGERYLVYLTEGLRSLGHRVDVLLSDLNYMDGWAQSLSTVGAQVHRRSLIGLRHRPLRFVQSIHDHSQIASIAAACREIEPDAILVNQQYDEDGLDYLAGALASQTAPVGGLMHMPMTRDKHKRPLGSLRSKLLASWYQRHPYRLMLVAQGGQEEFEQFYSHPRPTFVVHYGIPIRQNPAPDDSPHSVWADSLPVIGFVGQLVPQKNLSLLIEGWLKARIAGAHCRLLLIGDGPERIAIEERLQREVPADAWHITGWVSAPEAFFPSVSIYAMTSHFEGLPLSLLEAAGRGLPSIVTNFNGASDVVERAPWVRVIPSADPESVSRAILSALKDLPELQALATRGQNGFRAYFSVERMAKDTVIALGLT